MNTERLFKGGSLMCISEDQRVLIYIFFSLGLARKYPLESF